MKEGARVLLAYCDPVVLAAGERTLYAAGFEVVGLCDNGPDTLRMIREMEPDVVLMSLYLREKNALYVLERLGEMPLGSMPAVAVAISDNQTDYLCRAEELGSFAAIPLPALPADMVEAVRAAQPLDRMIPCFAKEQVIRDILDRMSIDRRLKGYEYFVTAIGIACRSHTFFRAMTTVVYPETAKLHGTTQSRLERCMRTAIDSAWTRGDLERQYAYFGNTIDVDRGKPTNSEFIARITEALRLEAM
ncbi:MAG: response regulator [Clostridia bacterium]|nr:response regulator [Clostridia bacterium]